MGYAVKLIQTSTTTSGSTQFIDFNSIPQTYQDLMFVVNARYNGSVAGTWYDYMIQFNGITANGNYKDRFLYGAGGNCVSQQDANSMIIRYPGKDTNAANFSTSNWYIPNYRGSQNKTMWSEGGQQGIGSTSMIINSSVGKSTLTSAITSIRLLNVDNGNFSVGSTFSLYGIAAN